jgi:hypothetical protein
MGDRSTGLVFIEFIPDVLFSFELFQLRQYSFCYDLSHILPFVYL